MRQKYWLLIVGCILGLFLFNFQNWFSVKAQSTTYLNNGGFENGEVGWQDGANVFTVQSGVARIGSAARLAGSGSLAQQWISLDPGNYTLKGWIRLDSVTGGSWGGVRAQIINDSWQELGTTGYLDASNTVLGDWLNVAVNINLNVPTNIGVQLGSHSDRTFVAYFDEFSLFKKIDNIPPVTNPKALTAVSGQAPLTVQLQANASDSDGVIEVYQWDFGDGGYETVANPNYIFHSKGNYAVKLTVYDDSGDSAEGLINVVVTDPEAPTININTSTNVTMNEFIDLTGTVSDNGQVVGLTWDNINYDQAGSLANPGSAWSIAHIPLKPGNNEILVTAIDNNHQVATDILNVYRNINGPVISNIQTIANTVNVYEKFEVKFNLQTVADYYLFPYDENAPYDRDSKTGITVEGVFTTPSGQQIIQPGFYLKDVQLDGSWQAGRYRETPVNNWIVRLSPQEVGNWKFSLKAKDASGETLAAGGSFEARSALKPGFIKVSSRDSRYFEFSNGTLFWPMGLLVMIINRIKIMV
ncbi:PKD domain-containing protein [Patescibacteria group bacterium]|nr:PKD domain-containing protein [Patescibacteria group bacterium]